MYCFQSGVFIICMKNLTNIPSIYVQYRTRALTTLATVVGFLVFAATCRKLSRTADCPSHCSCYRHVNYCTVQYTHTQYIKQDLVKVDEWIHPAAPCVICWFEYCSITATNDDLRKKRTLQQYLSDVDVCLQVSVDI